MPLGQQLHGADAVSADGLEQSECLGIASLEASAQALANPLVVRQQVVEVVGNHLPANLARAGDGQGQRQSVHCFKQVMSTL
jgi:hypothetical protein